MTLEERGMLADIAMAIEMDKVSELSVRHVDLLQRLAAAPPLSAGTSPDAVTDEEVTEALVQYWGVSLDPPTSFYRRMLRAVLENFIRQRSGHGARE